MKKFEEEVLGTEIVVPAIEMIDPRELIEDADNPNEMTEEQENSLTKTIQKHGFLVPIITNKDLMIADGAHRKRIAIRLGMKTVPFIRLDLPEVDRRILRQVMNKLRGQHNELLDAAEFQRIKEANKIEDLVELLAVRRKEIEATMSRLEQEPKDYSKDIPQIHEVQNTMTFLVSSKQQAVVLKALNKTGIEEKSQALVSICKAYLKEN